MTTAAVAALSACAPPPEPVKPPPQVVIPPRPWPPMGAAPNLTIPQIGPDGIRRTVNTGISHYQTVWNMRSAYNVAALNCQKPEHAAILNGYKQFLKDNSKALTKVNGELDKQFKSDYGSKYIRERETYNTQVYNYFA
ncbi:MAG: hypothetical protein KDE55_22450, partial [Novosphingobium sp.]|nr:hypothetical protein [Novosphingobium sp.]